MGVRKMQKGGGGKKEKKVSEGEEAYNSVMYPVSSSSEYSETYSFQETF